MEKYTQSYIAAVLTLFLGVTGFTSLNNQNSLYQLQQIVSGFLAPTVSQGTVLPVANAASVGSASQVSASEAASPTEQQEMTSSSNESPLLKFDAGDGLFLSDKATNAIFSIVYTDGTTVTQSIPLTIESDVAQTQAGDALKVAYHNPPYTIVLEQSGTKTLTFTLQEMPPTGKYLARFVAYNDTLRVSQSVPLVVVNPQKVTLQQQLAAMPDKQIVMSVGRGWPFNFFCKWELCTYNNSKQYYQFQLPIESSDTYILSLSQFYDSNKGHFAQLCLTQVGTECDTSSQPTQAVTVANKNTVTIQPKDIQYPGAYTGTLTIIDRSDGSIETIPVLVNARVHSLIPFFLILVVSFAVGWAVLGLDHVGTWVWSVFASTSGLGYIESRLPTFGDTSDYYFTLSWVIGGSILASPAIIALLKDKNGDAIKFEMLRIRDSLPGIIIILLVLVIVLGIASLSTIAISNILGVIAIAMGVGCLVILWFIRKK